MENPFKMDDFGVPWFVEIPIYKSATSSRNLKKVAGPKSFSLFLCLNSLKLRANKCKICTIRATRVFPYMIKIDDICR